MVVPVGGVAADLGSVVSKAGKVAQVIGAERQIARIIRETEAPTLATIPPPVPRVEVIPNYASLTAERLKAPGAKPVPAAAQQSGIVPVPQASPGAKMTSIEIKNARQRGVRRAKAAERDLVKSGHAGTADDGGWTWSERKAIAKSGTFPADARWHHSNDVNRNPELADVPGNVIPSRGDNAGHVKKYHQNGTQAGSQGPLIDRSALKEKHLEGGEE